VIFGLSENIESLVQESGRSMRGGDAETQGQTGHSFFLHKGALGEHFACLNVSIILSCFRKQTLSTKFGMPRAVLKATKVSN
jgi:hypothetical protein